MTGQPYLSTFSVICHRLIFYRFMCDNRMPPMDFWSSLNKTWILMNFQGIWPFQQCTKLKLNTKLIFEILHFTLSEYEKQFLQRRFWYRFGFNFPLTCCVKKFVNSEVPKKNLRNLTFHVNCQFSLTFLKITHQFWHVFQQKIATCCLSSHFSKNRVTLIRLFGGQRRVPAQLRAAAAHLTAWRWFSQLEDPFFASSCSACYSVVVECLASHNGDSQCSQILEFK